MIVKPDMSYKPTRKGIARRMRRPILISAIAAAAMAASAGPADATTFSGSCTGTGILTSDPPMGFIPAQRKITYESSGHCSGTLDGRAVRDIRYDGLAAAEGLFFCGVPTASPSAVITFRPPNGPRRTLHLQAHAVVLGGPHARLVLRGASEGVAHGQHDASVGTGGSTASECLSGTRRTVGWTISIATITPLVG